ncbi:YeeE/YedE family protein [Halorhodospira halochloris]|uniref:Lipocalin-related protein and Bos/Can/Equ allergen n=1 Tax=Halorhodospira halochloris TaxID=1052 RepID=A0A0X8XB76_HALHR|nr:YeeE/YedE family protein [Halorhodospira halochloris]MBK1652198.1 hypothetical protein [Halorhodospira halochloris]MCG5531238.1 YeeE/YedE family protein [Halorhodospira halochloris]BAU58382.1 lipocalin-related protein and Bos/Can/Equ allergen [Halorhodospira halochloris]
MGLDTLTSAHWLLFGSTFVVAVILGAVVNKTNFCTMGAVSDIVNMQDWQRMRAWILAMAVAIIGVGLLEPLGLISADQTAPPYRGVDISWAGAIVGGLLFGIGMTLASGCGNKTVVRIGGGNIKSLFVAIVLGLVAYFTINPPGLDDPLRIVLFEPLAIPHTHGQDLGSLIAGEAAELARMFIAVILGAALLFFVFRASEFRANKNHILGGLVVGLSVVAVWALSSSISVEGERPQGIVFVGPIADTLEFFAGGLNFSLMNVGVAVVLGVIVGSLLWSLISGTFRVEWFASKQDFSNHFIGGILMGLGGPLSMGCTFGQGITALSTLAITAPLAIAGLIIGSALTMKVQYYKMLHEDEATVAKALITGMVDLRLLPQSMRRLDDI